MIAQEDFGRRLVLCPKTWLFNGHPCSVRNWLPSTPSLGTAPLIVQHEAQTLLRRWTKVQRIAQHDKRLRFSKLSVPCIPSLPSRLSFQEVFETILHVDPCLPKCSAVQRNSYTITPFCEPANLLILDILILIGVTTGGVSWRLRSSSHSFLPWLISHGNEFFGARSNLLPRYLSCSATQRMVDSTPLVHFIVTLTLSN
jgi:hypothetical protein